MKRNSILAVQTVLTLLTVPTVLHSQNPVMQAMWTEGMERSQTERLAQVLMDSIGPRLAGSAGLTSAVNWIAGVYEGMGIPVRRDNYGTWRGWRYGTVTMDLIAPRHQMLEAELLAWSPGTTRPAEGEAVVVPQLPDSAAARRWLSTVRGKFVLVSRPEAMCRGQHELEQFARPATVERVNAQRVAMLRDLSQRTALFGSRLQFHRGLEAAGVAGIITSDWAGGWGVNTVFDAQAERVPTVDLSCEDYGLIWRLASNNQGPRLRLSADAQQGPPAPLYNVIAELRGSELPNEYVMLSAHLDTWHTATGATDNGTGTIMMLEAMRILKATYPNPRRTILVGHWGPEEIGLTGSRAFAEDNPAVIEGLQALFNQDNGTWRIEAIAAQPWLNATSFLSRWVGQLPRAFSDSIALIPPDSRGDRGSDHGSFSCRGAPAFRLQSNYTEYRQYTWHTNLDTYDKIVFDDLKMNATIAAMLAYAASEDPQRFPHVTPATGRDACVQGRRAYQRPQ